MQITMIPGEPLGAVIARVAADRHRGAGQEIRRMMPERAGAYVGFALPLHLAKLAAQLPANINATPRWLAETFTGYPAIAPLLEQAEQERLVRSMIDGERAGHFPICHGREVNAAKKRIRYCPACVGRDRAELGFAGLRIAHNIHGVTACPEHECGLVEVDCGFGDNAVVGDADEMIGGVVPEPTAAGATEVLFATDIARLFLGGCPRPGRQRIASFLRRALVAAGYGIEGKLDEARIVADLETRFPETLAAMYAEPIPQRIASWRNCYAPAPRLYPVMKLALLGRLTEHSLADVLTGAARAEALPSAGTVRAPNTPRRGSRREKKSAARGLHRDWSHLDGELEERVRWIARVYRAHAFRPCRISAQTLAKAAGAVRWRRPALWKATLPRFHAALVEEIDTPFRYADRALSWLLKEIRAGRIGRFRGHKSFLDCARLAKLAAKNPTVAAAAREAFIEQAPLGEQLALFDVESCAPRAAA